MGREPQVRGLRSTINLCLGAANNLDIQGVEGRNVILPNSDVFLCPGPLRAAVPNMNLHPEVAVAGARLVGPDSLPSLQRGPCAYRPCGQVSKLSDFRTFRPNFG
jgi:hypothetical protein